MAYTSAGESRRDRMAYDDRGDIILGWFTRVAVFLLLLGIVAFEGISLVSARFSGSDEANQVAVAAADAYAPRKSVKAALAAAEDQAAALKVDLVADKFLITDDGSIDLSISKTATTLFLYRTQQTAKWAVVTSSGHASGRLR